MQLHMGPTCGEKHLDLCSEEQKKQITDAQVLSSADSSVCVDPGVGIQAMSDADITEALKTKADKITAMKAPTPSAHILHLHASVSLALVSGSS
jgi:hypothetical protein